ncbi:hypothetical protein, partial, partial [Absidia glauca]
MFQDHIFRSLTCHVCKRTGFYQKRNLRQHYNVIHGFDLPVATKFGKTRAPLHATYVQSEENANTIHYKCPCCAASLASLILLEEHINYHSGVNPTGHA